MTNSPTPTPTELASTAYEAIRALAHTTFGGVIGFEEPADVYDTVANLKQAAASLSQCLDQTGQFLTRLAATDHLESHQGDLNRRLAESLAGLDDAARAAQALYRGLDRAHSGLGPIAYKD